MTTSPMMHTSTPPTGNSPSLRAAGGSKGTMTPMSLPASSPATAYQQPSSSPRSYARAPPVRPYGSPLLGRSKVNAKEPQGDTKAFGELVAHMVEERTRMSRRGTVEEAVQQQEEARGAKSVGGSLSGSLEKDRAELIVDVPVWSPGCFQGTSLSFVLWSCDSPKTDKIRPLHTARIEGYHIGSYPFFTVLSPANPFLGFLIPPLG